MDIPRNTGSSIIELLAPITDKAIAKLSYYQPLIEMGAGDGTWLRAMRKQGIDVIGYDIKPRGPGVEIGDGAKLLHSSRTLLMIWPEEGGLMLLNILTHYQGNRFLTIGDTGRFAPDVPKEWDRELLLRLSQSEKGENHLLLWTKR